MAVADRVFDKEHKLLAEFDNRYIRQGTNSRPITIKETEKKKPILRKLVNKSISPTEIMGASSIAKYLRELGRRCGYQDDLTSYSFRRGFANSVEGTGTSSPQVLKRC